MAGHGAGVTPGVTRMEKRRVARQMTVDFVTINYEGVSGGEDDSSISSSSSRYDYLPPTSSSQGNHFIIFQTFQRHLLP